MGNRYLIVSDLHLCDVEDHVDGWMSHKASKYLFDDEFGALVREFVKKGGPGDTLFLILNGDIFDFDLVTAIPDPAPWPVSRSERKRGLNPTDAKSRWKLELIISHHPRFVDTLAEYLCAGHRLVYILGNHDRELHFSGTRAAFISAIRSRAGARGGDFSDDALTIEPWFFLVPGELYVEHGQQHDSYTSFRHVLSPTVELGHEEQLALPMGNLSNRYLMSRMGFFNPHSSDYILNLYSYVRHWLTHYAFSRRSLAMVWLWGSIAVIFRLLKIKRKLLGRPPKRQIQEVARHHQIDVGTLEALYHLQQPPITSRFYRIVREFWIDRLLLILIMVGGTVPLWLSSVAFWLKIVAPACSFPLLFLLYERLTQGETIFSIEEKLPKVARAISRLVPVKVVAFGHTHVPRMVPIAKGVSLIDTGAWAPVTGRRDPGRLEAGYRNYARVLFKNGRALIDFDSWLEDSSLAATARAPSTVEGRVRWRRPIRSPISSRWTPSPVLCSSGIAEVSDWPAANQTTAALSGRDDATKKAAGSLCAAGDRCGAHGAVGRVKPIDPTVPEEGWFQEESWLPGQTAETESFWNEEQCWLPPASWLPAAAQADSGSSLEDPWPPDGASLETDERQRGDELVSGVLLESAESMSRVSDRPVGVAKPLDPKSAPALKGHPKTPRITLPGTPACEPTP